MSDNEPFAVDAMIVTSTNETFTASYDIHLFPWEGHQSMPGYTAMCVDAAAENKVKPDEALLPLIRDGVIDAISHQSPDTTDRDAIAMRLPLGCIQVCVEPHRYSLSRQSLTAALPSPTDGACIELRLTTPYLLPRQTFRDWSQLQPAPRPPQSTAFAAVVHVTTATDGSTAPAPVATVTTATSVTQSAAPLATADADTKRTVARELKKLSDTNGTPTVVLPGRTRKSTRLTLANNNLLKNPNNPDISTLADDDP